ncbi:MAG TPA: glutamate--tRNA ligase family protein [Kiritimatiellia bacterium]|nr:glutamate--tRNA ligase family protein [Kiritimatiellia bacterium]HMP34154.1 glutamate--tRNA ligase family protein [Kiritimatiellia bacterium]
MTAPLVTRFAPSTTGHAHPGTLLSGLLCWLAARAAGGRVVLRLEDLDPQRCRPELTEAMIEELSWFGLDWDSVEIQHRALADHEAALDRLAAAGLLYPCSCSRSRLKAIGRPAPDGGFAYDNQCRSRLLPATGWRSCSDPLRVRMPDTAIDVTDDSGLRITQHPARDMGDPVVRRRDGAIAYHLACVVDDARLGVTHLIRGRDLAPSAPVQMLLQQALHLPTPRYRHHLLLLETTGGKLAKFHQSVAVPTLRRHYAAEALCGWIAHAAGLTRDAAPVRPVDLVAGFSWDHLRAADRAITWDGVSLRTAP